MQLKRARKFLFMWALKLLLMRLRKSVCDTMNLQDDNSFSPLSVCLNMRLLQSVLTLYIINRSGTLIKGCEGYNHQHTCKWGNSLCFIFCHLIVYSFFLFSEMEINLTFRERENFRTESILMLKAYSGFHEFEESIYHCFICRLLEKLLLWRAWMHGYEKYAVT